MSTYLLTYLFWLSLFTITHLSLFLPQIIRLIKNQGFYRLIYLLLILLQIISIASFKKEVGDVMLFSGAGWHLRHRIDFYWIDSDHSQYPFFPFLIFLHAGLNWLQENLITLTFSFLLKLVLLTALHLIAKLIFRTQKTQIKARVQQLRFLTAPISYAVVLFHGQVDVILLLFFLIAWWLINQKTPKLKTYLISALSFAASIASKTWSVVFLPLTLQKLKNWPTRLVYLVAIAISLLVNIFIYTRIVFGSNIGTVLQALGSPGGPIGHWGFSLIFRPYLETINKYRLAIFAFGFLFTQVLIWKQKLNSWTKLLATIIGIYLIIPNWGAQYSFWFLPFFFFNLKQQKSFIGKIFYLSISLYTSLMYVNIALINPHKLLGKLNLLLAGLTYLLALIWWWQLTFNTQALNLSKQLLPTQQQKT
ncbi:MAG: hypothetical protein GF390_00370 [Candidatus Pacebacteria bacterium]|nr:hypothetical protein [Candidatus Paceibacterota bacterium]